VIPIPISVTDHDAELRRIETMLGSADDARGVIRRFIGVSGNIRDDDAGDVCATLKSCVGRLLRSEAERDVLVRWHGLLKAVSTNLHLRTIDARHSIAVGTLADLVFERAGMARDSKESAEGCPGMMQLIDAVRAFGGSGCPIESLSTPTGFSKERIERLVVYGSDRGLLETVRRSGSVVVGVRTRR
jgi:hypothetical protein